MSFFGGGGSGPSVPPLPPPPPPPPTPVDPAVVKARASNRQQAALAGGRQSTILTSAQGLTSNASTTKKTYLGS